MEHLGGHGDNLGEKTDGKYTMENQKNFEKDARQRRIQVEVHNNPVCYLSTMRRIKLALAENEVGASGQNASENKITAVKFNDMTESDWTFPAADQV